MGEQGGEAFKIRLIEQQAEIKEALKNIQETLRNHEFRLLEAEKALWGKGESVGLLEKHRSLLRTWAIIISIGSFLAAAVGKIISPLYDKAISDYVFNSPSQRWMREQQRPKVKVFKIYRKAENPSE